MDQEPRAADFFSPAPGWAAASALVVVQRKLLDGDGLGPLAIRRSTEPRYAPRLRMMMTRQLLAGFLGMGTPGHAGKIVAAGRESELVVCQRGK